MILVSYFGNDGDFQSCDVMSGSAVCVFISHHTSPSVTKDCSGAAVLPETPYLYSAVVQKKNPDPIGFFTV